MSVATPEPQLLPPNQIEHFYRGGDRIAALRDAIAADPAGTPG